MPCSPAVSAAISASTRTRVPTWVNLTVPCACDPLAGRTTAVAEGPSGCIVAHDDRSSAHAASLNACFILFPPYIRLLPSFPRSVGSALPTLVPAVPSVMLGRCSASPSDTLHLVVLGQSGLPQRDEEAGLFPFQKPLMDGTGAAEPFPRQR